MRHDSFCVWKLDVDDSDNCPMCRFIIKVRADERNATLQDVKDYLSAFHLEQVIRHRTTQQVLATAPLDTDRIVEHFKSEH